MTISGRRSRFSGGVLTELAELPLEVIAAQAHAALGEIVVLKDDLHLRAAPMGFVADGLHVLLDYRRKTA